MSPAPVEAAAPTQRTAIVDATQAFLTNCQNRGVVDATLRKYKTFVKQLIAYCESRGYLYVDQLSMHDMDRFYALWKDGLCSQGKKLDKLKSFVKFCLKRKWLAENISDHLEPPKGSSGSANKAPFTDDELNRMYTACDAFGPPIAGGAGSSGSLLRVKKVEL